MRRRVKGDDIDMLARPGPYMKSRVTALAHEERRYQNALRSLGPLVYRPHYHIIYQSNIPRASSRRLHIHIQGSFSRHILRNTACARSLLVRFVGRCEVEADTQDSGIQ